MYIKFLPQNFLHKIGMCCIPCFLYASRCVSDYITGKHGKQKLINARTIYQNTLAGDSE